jgi:putative Holliday junction resolvase
MRYIGIDYGEKRVGVAVSDESRALAFPLKVLPNSPQLVSEIAEICREQQAALAVVGDSKDFAQNDNEIMKEVWPFVEALREAAKIPVELHPEFLTSHQAEKLQGKNEMLDASAAAILLQSFLDTQKNTK